MQCMDKKGYAWFTDGKEDEDGNGDDVFSMMIPTLIQMLIWMCLRVGFEEISQNKIISIV